MGGGPPWPPAQCWTVMSSHFDENAVVNEQQLTASTLTPAQIFGRHQFETASWTLGKRPARCPLVFRHGGLSSAATEPCSSLHKGGPQSNVIRAKEVDRHAALNVGTSLATHSSTLLPFGALTRHWPLIVLERKLAGRHPPGAHRSPLTLSLEPPGPPRLSWPFSGLFLSLISDISGGHNALGPFRTSCVALIAPLLNVLGGVDSLGVRFELASESSKAYPSSAPGDIVGLSGCFAPPRQPPGESKPGIFARPPGSHHEDRLPPVRAARGRCR